MTESNGFVLYTIGHSNHPFQEFVQLLKTHAISAVVDVRSQPYSRYCPQYNSRLLAASLKQVGVTYVFLGKELGARPEEPSCFENGQVSFERLAKTEQFVQGIERVIKGMAQYRIVMMCLEKDPLECHRTILIARHLSKMGIAIKHIHSDGTLEDHRDAEKRLLKLTGVVPELFEPSDNSGKLLDRAYDQQAANIAHHTETVTEAS